MTLMASLGYFTIVVIATGAVLPIVPTQVVDFDEVLSEGFTLANAVVGYEAAFVSSP